MTTCNLSPTLHVCEDTSRNVDIRGLLIQAGYSAQGELNIKNFTVLLPDDTESAVNTPLFGMLDTDTVYVRPGDRAANYNAVSAGANSAAAFPLALWEWNNDNTNLLAGDLRFKNLSNAVVSQASIMPGFMHGRFRADLIITH